MQLLVELHSKKDYKIGTLFLAADIYDRYLLHLGHWNFERCELTALATISMILAAKLDQPIQPSINRMIEHLSEEEL